MLRLFLLIILTLFLIQTFSQDTKFPLDSTTGKIKFSEVVYVDSASKVSLYNKAREWFVKSFKSSKAVLDLDDKESGKLIGKGNFIVVTDESLDDNEFAKGKRLVPKELREKKNQGDIGSVSFTISIYIKDGRYKYEVSNLSHKGTTITVAGYTATQPDGGDLSNIDPICGYSQWMPRIRWKNIKTNAFSTVQNLIVDLKTIMATKDELESF